MITEKEIEEAVKEILGGREYRARSESFKTPFRYAFPLGAHFGYAKAIEQASEGEKEAFNKCWDYFKREMDIDLTVNDATFFKQGYRAAKLSSAKEFNRMENAWRDRCDKEFREHRQHERELEAQLAVAIECLRRCDRLMPLPIDSDDKSDPRVMIQDALTRLKSNGPITSEGKHDR
jgi:hypothetical protein